MPIEALKVRLKFVEQPLRENGQQVAKVLRADLVELRQRLVGGDRGRRQVIGRQRLGGAGTPPDTGEEGTEMDPVADQGHDHFLDPLPAGMHEGLAAFLAERVDLVTAVPHAGLVGEAVGAHRVLLVGLAFVAQQSQSFRRMEDSAPVHGRDADVEQFLAGTDGPLDPAGEPVDPGLGGWQRWRMAGLLSQGTETSIIQQKNSRIHHFHPRQFRHIPAAAVGFFALPGSLPHATRGGGDRAGGRSTG